MNLLLRRTCGNQTSFVFIILGIGTSCRELAFITTAATPLAKASTIIHCIHSRATSIYFQSGRKKPQTLNIQHWAKAELPQSPSGLWEADNVDSVKAWKWATNLFLLKPLGRCIWPEFTALMSWRFGTPDTNCAVTLHGANCPPANSICRECLVASLIHWPWPGIA